MEWLRHESVKYHADLPAVHYKINRAGTAFHGSTPDEVAAVLENARNSGTRLYLRYGDTETGRDWLEEYDVAGRIGRSVGRLKVPLLLATVRSSGGAAILDHCIVRIATAKGQVLYQHPRYIVPEFVVETRDDPALPAVVLEKSGMIVAGFRNLRAADRYVRKMARLTGAEAVRT